MEDDVVLPNSSFSDSPQPMEVVAQVMTTKMLENQPDEDPQSLKYVWKIENFSCLNGEKYYSDIFYVGGYKWQMEINFSSRDHLSLHLCVVDSTKMLNGWSIGGQFSLAVVSQNDSQKTWSSAGAIRWGFRWFMPLSKLCDIDSEYIKSGTVVVAAEVAVKGMYDSKKETGFVGLKENRPASYVNSLLQILYHIPYFRKIVFSIPTTESDMLPESTTLALQNLFCELQCSDNHVAMRELSKYFACLQHDVLQFSSVLWEKLEDKMKGTVMEGTIHKLFQGHRISYIECIHVDCKSTREESFYGLHLDVKGCPDVYASFDKYVEVECLAGDNQYDAALHGLQDARKHVQFIDFPPILLLELNRFEYNKFGFSVVKINDCYNYPHRLDLNRYIGKGLSPEANRRVCNVYALHSVLVRSASVNSRPYYAFIKPTLSDQWFKFYGELVTKEDRKWALEEQFGGDGK